MNSAPCKECLEQIQKMNIKKIVFINEDNNIIEIKPENFKTDHYSSSNKYKNNKN